MAYEMEKADFMEEMMSDTLDDAMGVEEEEVDEEVDKVIMELTMGILDGAEAAPTQKIATSGRELLRQSLDSERTRNKLISKNVSPRLRSNKLAIIFILMLGILK